MASLEWYSMAFEKASQVFVLLYEIVYLCATAMFYYLKLKIFWSIVSFVIVLVMDIFCSKKWSTKNSGHYQAMLKDNGRFSGSLLLRHTLTQLLIFWRQSPNRETNIPCISLHSRILSLFTSSMSLLGWKSLSGTLETHSSIDRSEMNKGIPSNPSVFLAHSTSNKKGKTVSIVNNFKLVPMNFTSVKKIEAINWFRDWFSAHFDSSFSMAAFDISNYTISSGG